MICYWWNEREDGRQAAPLHMTLHGTEQGSMIRTEMKVRRIHAINAGGMPALVIRQYEAQDHYTAALETIRVER